MNAQEIQTTAYLVGYMEKEADFLGDAWGNAKKWWVDPKHKHITKRLEEAAVGAVGGGLLGGLTEGWDGVASGALKGAIALPTMSYGVDKFITEPAAKRDRIITDLTKKLEAANAKNRQSTQQAIKNKNEL
jgi:uncharacterized membrane protein